MERLACERYVKELDAECASAIQWDKLQNKTILISGATGMIGTYMIDLIMRKNNTDGLRCSVIALGRSKERLEKRFAAYLERPELRLEQADLSMPLAVDAAADYVIHGASSTHPLAYVSDPIGTISVNVMGTNHMLSYAAAHGARFVFLSTVEVYGENTGACERFAENDFGYIDCNTLRAGYPESKRTGEALCQAYIRQCGVDAVIPRLSRAYGPTLLDSDTKALSQFIRKAVSQEDIVLKSAGTQQFSYVYVADAVTAILTCMLEGKNGEAYNVCDEQSDVTLAALAGMLAEGCGRQVVFEIPDAVEQAGYSKATKALLDNTKLKALGWQAHYPMKRGLEQTVSILRALKA